MKGQTLLSFQGKIVLKKKTFELPMVPIGMDCPVVIPIHLMNIGTNQVGYQLDLEDFALNNPNLIKDNIISFRNESGQLQQGERQNLLILFKPNSEERIMLFLYLKIRDFFKKIEVIKINIYGKGTHAFSINHLNKFFKIDDQNDNGPSTEPNDKKIVNFSTELLDFRNLEMNRTHDRLIVVTNNSSEYAVKLKLFNLVYFVFPKQQ